MNAGNGYANKKHVFTLQGTGQHEVCVIFYLCLTFFFLLPPKNIYLES